MVFENGVTDLLPMDLMMQHIDGKISFLFDWRKYFCTLFYDQQDADEWSDYMEVKSCVRLSGELDSHESIELAECLASAYTTSALVNAAGTTEIGHDGRLLMAGRRRRFRLGLKSGQLRYRERPYTRDIFDHRFERLDEERVIEKLHREQLLIHDLCGRAVIEW
ncbi:hypothetical protein MW887_003624 [Aspergillus wentii]|nr:hypothetical protein MW887_003624 [Aspergillus wentii]